MRVKELALLVSGTVRGDESLFVNGVSEIGNASPSQLVFALTRSNVESALVSAAQVIVVAKQLEVVSDIKTIISVSNSRLAMAKILTVYDSDRQQLVTSSKLIHESVILGNTEVGEGVIIGPGCVVGDGVVIGANTVIHPNVVIYPDTKIGANVLLHSGVVIGADGFGFVRDGKSILKVPQLGIVVIEDDVEIGANTTIDRATIGETRVGFGTKIDNQVQIAHNCIIGEYSIIAACCAVAGSSVLGKRVTMGGYAAVADHVNIGDDVIIAGKAGVTKDVVSGTIVSGFPAQDHKAELHFWAKLKRLVKA